MKQLPPFGFFLIVVLLLSCSGGGGGEDKNAECGQYWKNKYVYDLLQDSYLWYDRVDTTIDHTAFSSPQALLDAVKPPMDRWSYISTAEAFYDFNEEGRFPGMGLSLKFDGDRRLWVNFVYAGSPADDAGIKRSDEILEINGRPASQLVDLETVWDEIYRNESAMVEIRTQDIDVRTETLEWEWVTINTVLHTEVIEIGDRQVGYLVFKSFIEPAVAELETAFAGFKQRSIDDLVLDLRYNGGGRGAITLQLASLITGENTVDEVFRKTIHNDKYSRYDDIVLFTEQTSALGLERLFVITTDETCSASELIIHGLRPYIPVIQVGTTTCGKPVGMYAQDFCDLVILPVQYKSANANDETDYFDGLPPTCPASDDLTRQFGDQEEDSLKTALHYIANDACPAGADTVRSLQAEKPLPINELKGLRREIGAF